jgi:hypothetical protein
MSGLGFTWTPGWELRAEKHQVVPDAEPMLFRRQGDKRAEVFVRCTLDRATESPSHVVAQCQRYLAWRQEQRRTDRESLPLYVDRITTSAQRVAMLRAEIRRRIGTARKEGTALPVRPQSSSGPEVADYEILEEP